MISIVIPVYNGAQSIKRAIDSALSQDTSKAYEILVIDNASSDETAKVLSKYQDGKIRIVRFDQNVNMWGNHNRAWSLANGNFVLFLHADDALLPEALSLLQLQVKLPLAKRTIMWGASQFRDFSIHCSRCGLPLNEVLGGERVFPLLVQGGLTPSGTLFPREIMQEVGGFIDIGETKYEGDHSSLLYWALNHLQFKMLSDLFFVRQSASTSLPDRSVLDERLFAAYDKVLETSSSEVFSRIASIVARSLKSGKMTKFEEYCFQKGILSLRQFLKRKLRRKFRIH